MHRSIIRDCLCIIESKAQSRGRSLAGPEIQLWEGVLSEMDDETGVLALRQVILNSPFPPDIADVRREYAQLMGAAPGENPDDAVARRERERLASERLRLHVRQYQADCRRKYERIMADPVLRAEWFRSRLGGLPDLSNVMAGIMASHTEEPKS